MLSQHGGWAMSADDMTPVGVWTNLAEDGIGLKAEGVPAPTQRGRELHALARMQPRPAIDGLSIGYIAKESTPRSSRRSLAAPSRRLTCWKSAWSHSPPMAAPASRASRPWGGTERDIERWLMQDAGFSRREARIAINHGFKALIDSGTQDAAEGGTAEPPPSAAAPQRWPDPSTTGAITMDLGEIKSLMTAQATAWEEFKRTNDERLAKLAKGESVTDLEAKLAKTQWRAGRGAGNRQGGRHQGRPPAHGWQQRGQQGRGGRAQGLQRRAQGLQRRKGRARPIWIPRPMPTTRPA